MGSEGIKTKAAAHGRWRDILPRLGIPTDALNGKNQPCPACGGTDRFRFDDRQGDGDYYCNGCGAGHGLTLLMKVNGWSYAEAAKRVDEVIGNVPGKVVSDASKPDQVEPREAARALWRRSQAITLGDPVWRYLESRGLRPVSAALRYLPLMYHADSRGDHPGMVAKVSNAQGKDATLHRTYLTADGRKAAVDPVRKLMQGDFPQGGAVRLHPPAAIMGVAEGIETAMAAEILFGIPVWPTISETNLRTWEPPPEARHVVICGDNDRNYVGQHAAYALARRLSVNRKKYAHLEVVEVQIPETAGADWNDVLGAKNARAA